MCYFLEGYLQELEVSVRKSFKSSYVYNESIIGSWEIDTPINYSYSVLYTIFGLGSWKCHNTILEVFPNASSVITAFLPPQSWNDSISIQLIVRCFTDLTIVSSMQNFTISDHLHRHWIILLKCSLISYEFTRLFMNLKRLQVLEISLY